MNAPSELTLANAPNAHSRNIRMFMVTEIIAPCLDVWWCEIANDAVYVEDISQR